MRISPEQIQQIKQAVKDEFGEQSRVWLFGSRVDDDAKGGDIDLLVKTRDPVGAPAQLIARLMAKLMMRLGDRKIDIVLDAPNLERKSIHEIAQHRGVLL